MPKGRVIKIKFAPNIPAGKNVNQRVIAPGKKKSAPGVQKANNPKG